MDFVTNRYWPKIGCGEGKATGTNTLLLATSEHFLDGGPLYFEEAQAIHRKELKALAELPGSKGLLIM